MKAFTSRFSIRRSMFIIAAFALLAFLAAPLVAQDRRAALVIGDSAPVAGHPCQAEYLRPANRVRYVRRDAREDGFVLPDDRGVVRDRPPFLSR